MTLLRGHFLLHKNFIFRKVTLAYFKWKSKENNQIALVLFFFWYWWSKITNQDKGSDNKGRLFTHSIISKITGFPTTLYWKLLQWNVFAYKAGLIFEFLKRFYPVSYDQWNSDIRKIFWFDFRGVNEVFSFICCYCTNDALINGNLKLNFI